MQTKLNLQLISLVGFSLMLSACGFQLRGTGMQNLAKTGITIVHHENLEGQVVYRYFEKELRRVLAQSDIELIRAGQLNVISSGAIQLNIMALNFSSQGVSRDATGRANEHEVTLRLDYQINRAVENEALGTEQEPEVHSLTTTASYYQDYRNPTAGRVQKNETQQLLISQLTQRLIRQLDFKLKN